MVVWHESQTQVSGARTKGVPGALTLAAGGLEGQTQVLGRDDTVDIENILAQKRVEKSSV